MITHHKHIVDDIIIISSTHTIPIIPNTYLTQVRYACIYIRGDMICITQCEHRFMCKLTAKLRLKICEMEEKS